MKSEALKFTGKFLTLVIIATSASLLTGPEAIGRGGGGHGFHGCGDHGGCGHYGGDHGYGHDGEFGRGLGDHFGLSGRGALGGRLPINHGYFNHAPYRYGWGGGPGWGGYYGLGGSYLPAEFYPGYYADGIELGQQVSSN